MFFFLDLLVTTTVIWYEKTLSLPTIGWVDKHCFLAPLDPSFRRELSSELWGFEITALDGLKTQDVEGVH